MPVAPPHTPAEDLSPSCLDAPAGGVQAASPPEVPPDPLAPPCTGETWTALYTLSRREKQVARACSLLGIRHYLPLREHWTRSGRQRVYEVPLFPSYVFACLGHRARAELLRTGAVAKVISVPRPGVLLGELREIRAALAAGADLEPGLALWRGVRVRLIRGPLAGIEGRVADLRRRGARERLVLNVSFLGVAAAVEIDPWDVERVRSAIEANAAA